MARIFNFNESYIFFRLVDYGPLGALEVPITPDRSVATDLRLFPKAALAFIQTEKPLVDEHGAIQSWETFGRFVLNQDTGGAIRGPGRVDIFWGRGPYAEVAAGHMKHNGSLFFLVQKSGEKESR
jgi:membrane-bound lytic murein transglycosylase A